MGGRSAIEGYETGNIDSHSGTAGCGSGQSAAAEMAFRRCADRRFVHGHLPARGSRTAESEGGDDNVVAWTAFSATLSECVARREPYACAVGCRCYGGCRD